jgi:L-alanine-DL-glutamate epimerase-like enolase superfamily enzyme
MPDVTITAVDAIALRLPAVHDRTDSSQDSVIVRVTASDGTCGYGEVDSSPTVVKAIIEAPSSHSRARGLRDVLIGRDPLDVVGLWSAMYEATLFYGRNGATVQAMAGVDLALWDLCGRLQGRSVVDLLGGALRNDMRVYASHMFDFDPRVTAQRAATAVDAGYSAVKFGWEPMGPDPRLDEQLVRGVRAAVGDEVDVAIDAGLAWDAPTAIERCALFEPYRLLWLEEPLHPDDLAGYRKLTDAVTTPIAAGEEDCTVEGFRRLMDEGGIDIVQVDVARTGLTQAMRIAALAEARGLPVCNHNFTTDINVAAAMHFLCSIPNAMIMEYCVEPSPLRTAVVREPIPVVDGRVRLPQGPGFGIEVALDQVERYVLAA